MSSLLHSDSRVPIPQDGASSFPSFAEPAAEQGIHRVHGACLQQTRIWASASQGCVRSGREFVADNKYDFLEVAMAVTEEGKS